MTELKSQLKVQLTRLSGADRELREVIEKQFPDFLSELTVSTLAPVQPDQIVAKYQLKDYINAVLDTTVKKHFYKPSRVKLDFLVNRATEELAKECRKSISDRFDYTVSITPVQDFIQHGQVYQSELVEESGVFKKEYECNKLLIKCSIQVLPKE